MRQLSTKKQSRGRGHRGAPQRGPTVREYTIVIVAIFEAEKPSPDDLNDLQPDPPIMAPAAALSSQATVAAVKPHEPARQEPAPEELPKGALDEPRHPVAPSRQRAA
jgi:hypothetical protein